ncbi:uncharacterized protein WCC33_010094 [Rhinophrynus dorsalis]
MAEGAGQVTFDDAVIYFSEEQWSNLEDFQKKIYKELMKEIYETMLALGYRIPKPEIVARIERGEDPCAVTCKKQKLQETQPEGLPVGSKDPDPVIKTERESPIPCTPVPPGEISSSQEKGKAVPCQACGTCCNSKCGMSCQLNAPRMYPGAAVDCNQGKRYVTPPPLYFNRAATSPGFASGAPGMAHATSPVAGYGNVGMGPLSPHFAGYRGVGDPHSPYPVPERSGNLMYGNYESNQQASVVAAGGNVGNPAHENRMRMEQFTREHPYPPHMPFQDRRASGGQCPGCGNFCSGQCGVSFQWEQKRLHHAAHAVMEGNQGNKYTSPNPYFNGNAPPSHFPNGRPGIRPANPPVTVHGNMGVGQVPPHYAGYRRSGESHVPNILRRRSEGSPSNVSVPTGTVASNAGGASHHGTNPGNKPGTFPATNNGNQKRAQTMSPLAAIETMPVFTGNGSPAAVNDQRIRQSAQTVTSSESHRDKIGMPPNGVKRPHAFQYSIQGSNVMVKGQQPNAQANNMRNVSQKAGDSINERNPSTTANISQVAKNGKQSTADVIILDSDSGREGHAVKRPAAAVLASDGAQAAKRASPLSAGGESHAGKHISPSATAASNPIAARATPPAPKPGTRNTPPVVISETNDVKKTTPPENKDGKLVRRSTPPITISSIRSSGIFIPPPSKAKNKEAVNCTSPIIIIDDKENKETRPHSSSDSVSKNEVRGSVSRTPPVTNPKGNGEPPAASSLTKVQGQGARQGSPVVVNKVQMQQSSPIIVTGSQGLGNTSIPVSVNGNQSIMLTFPVTVGNSGIMLATPLNITDGQITGIKPANRVPISKNPRLVQANAVPLNNKPGNANAKFAPINVTSIVRQANPVSVSMQSKQTKSITVNVNQQPSSIARNLNMKGTNVPKVNSGALKAVSVATNQAVGQTIPVFVDPNSGLILTAPAVASKDTISSGIGNATVVTVNGNVVAGNVAPVALGGKLAFSNITPVNVNGGLGIGNTTFFTVDRTVGIGNGTPVTLTGNPTAIGNKGTLNINNSAVLTMNGGLGIGNTGAAGAPLGNITTINANGNLQVAQASTSTVIGADQQSAGIVIRKVGEPTTSSSQQTSSNADQSVAFIDRLFRCSQCDASFSSLEILTNHQKNHREDKSTSENNVCEQTSKDVSETEEACGATEGDAHKILYTTQGDDGSTVYVVTV